MSSKHVLPPSKPLWRRAATALLLAAAACGAGTATAQIRLPLPPPPIRPLPLNPADLMQITAGEMHTITRRDGVALCWGSNNSGQIGREDVDLCVSFSCSLSPTRLATDASGRPFVAAHISAGRQHSCALDFNGRAFCWGLNLESQTGVPSLTRVTRPTDIGAQQVFSAIDAGQRTTCGIAGGQVFCWGDITFDRLGPTSPVPVRSLQPVLVQATNPIFDGVSVGDDHVCMRTSLFGFNEVYCRGDNLFGELGYDPAIGDAFVIFSTGFGRPVGTPRTRTGFTCADRLDTGTVLCSGSNARGTLGDGTPFNAFTPHAVGGGMALGGVAVGIGHACALDPQQRAWCWGDNGAGQLGNGSVGGFSTLPVLVGGGTVRFRTLAAGDRHSCGIATDNQVYCWGDNGSAQLGRGFVGGFAVTPGRTAAHRL
jgi:alpha-tubulin suppressor-like RCC1 family protein